MRWLGAVLVLGVGVAEASVGRALERALRGRGEGEEARSAVREALEEVGDRLSPREVREVLGWGERLARLELEDEVVRVLRRAEGGAIGALRRVVEGERALGERALAVEALGRIDRGASARALLVCAEGVEDERLVVWVVRWLGRARRSAEVAVPGLIELLGEAEGEVVEEVVGALREVTGEAWGSRAEWAAWWRGRRAEGWRLEVSGEASGEVSAPRRPWGLGFGEREPTWFEGSGECD